MKTQNALTGFVCGHVGCCQQATSNSVTYKLFIRLREVAICKLLFRIEKHNRPFYVFLLGLDFIAPKAQLKAVHDYCGTRFKTL
jgi:hypothetical protein